MKISDRGILFIRKECEPVSKKKREPVDPEHLKPEDRMKFEIAKELGLADKVVAGGWRCLTAKESGRIGGLVTKKKREMSAKMQAEQDQRENCH